LKIPNVSRRKTDNTTAENQKEQKDKQWSTKHYT
jgi:hypothetical protein